MAHSQARWAARVAVASHAPGSRRASGSGPRSDEGCRGTQAAAAAMAAFRARTPGKSPCSWCEPRAYSDWACTLGQSAAGRCSTAGRPGSPAGGTSPPPACSDWARRRARRAPMRRAAVHMPGSPRGSRTCPRTCADCASTLADTLPSAAVAQEARRDSPACARSRPPAYSDSARSAGPAAEERVLGSDALGTPPCSCWSLREEARNDPTDEFLACSRCPAGGARPRLLAGSRRRPAPLRVAGWPPRSDQMPVIWRWGR